MCLGRELSSIDRKCPMPKDEVLMRISLSILFACVALVFSSCSTVMVETDYDRNADFSKYSSYSLAPAGKGGTLSPSSENALRGALQSGLAAKGLKQSSGKGDLSVVRHVFAKDKVAVTEYVDWGYRYGPRGGWPYGYGRYGMWYGAPMVYTDVRQYTEGTIVLDFVDNRTNKLVFRGTGRGTLGSPESNARKIQEAVTKISAAYPAPALVAAAP